MSRDDLWPEPTPKDCPERRGEETPADNSYFPYLSAQDKIDAYKSAIQQHLGFAVHPDHLKGVRAKLDALEKFWQADLKANIKQEGGE